MKKPPNFPKIVAQSHVTWPSKYNDKKVFKGIVLRAIYPEVDTLVEHLEGGLAIVDDGNGLTARVIPTRFLTVTNDPTRIQGLRK